MGTTHRDPAGAGVLTIGGPTRREVLAGAGLIAGAGVLAACSSPSPGGGSSSTDGGSGGGGDGALAAVSDVPVGGGLSATLDGAPIILTQAEAGTIVGLSAICTHQGCTVAPNADRLLCPCHGSVYALDGTVISGPAPSPLPPVEVHVADGEVVAGAAG